MNIKVISVIIPCYNASRYIGATIESILVQSYSDFEVIIVDDGSTDDSASIINSFSDQRLRYIYQKNMGTCVAANFGLSVAKGDYIKFFDADDIMHPLHLEAQMNRLGSRKDALVSCKWGRFYNNDTSTVFFKHESVWKDMPALEWIKSSLAQRNDMMPAWLWLIPREIIEKTGPLNEQLSLNNDFEFSVRILLQVKDVLFAEKAEVYYRSGNQTSLTWACNELAFKSVLKATDLGCKHLLEKEDSDYMRSLCADRYKEWLFAVYPYYPEIQQELKLRIQKLGGSKRKMDGGFVFKSVSLLLGWRIAKRLKLYLQQKNYLKLPINLF